MILVKNNKYQILKINVSSNHWIHLEKRNSVGSKKQLNIDTPSNHMKDLEKEGYITLKKV